MKRTHNRKKYPAIALVFTLLCMLAYNFAPGVTYAGKEGVFLNGSAYFTLEEVALSKGTDSQSMQFRVMLNNDSDAALDFNSYGVKVLTTDGRSYYASLSEKADAIVQPGAAKSYAFIAKLAPGLTSDELMVDFFDRSRGNADIGALSVQKAISFQQNDHQFVFNLSDADTTYTGNTFVAVQAVKGFVIPSDNQWKVTLQTKVKVSGTDNNWNPSNLNYALNVGGGKTFPLKASTVESSQADGAITTDLLLTATLETQPELDKLTLDMNKNDASVTNLGKIALGSMFQYVKLGEKGLFDSIGKQGVSIAVTKAEEINQSGKRQALVTAVLHNEGKRTIANPVLTGILVAKEQAIALSTETVVDKDKYTVAGNTATYQFIVELPDEVVSGTYEFFVSESKSAQSSNSSSGSGTTGTGSSTSTGTSSGSSSSSSSTSSNTSSNSSSNSSTQSNTTTTASGVPVIAVDLDAGLTAGSGLASAGDYEIGQLMSFTPGNTTIDSNLEVSLVELTSHTNAQNGYQTVVAKFKFLNNSTKTLDLPNFATELQDAAGTSYPGARQTTVLQQLIPQSAYVYSYSYLMPPSAKGTFKLSIMEETSSNKLKLPIAAYQVAVHSADEDTPLMSGKVSLYPYTVNIMNWDLATYYSGGKYSYKLRMNLDIAKDPKVLVDDSFSTLEFELVDKDNRVLGGMTQTLQGTNKLVNGIQTFDFTDIKSDQFSYPITVNVYETMQTATGTAKRLVTKLQQ